MMFLQFRKLNSNRAVIVRPLTRFASRKLFITALVIVDVQLRLYDMRFPCYSLTKGQLDLHAS